MDSSARSKFRGVLILYVVLWAVLTTKVLLIGKGTLPDEALTYLRWWAQQPRSSLQSALAWVGLCVSFLSVICALAMTGFVRWARPLFAGSLPVLIAVEVQYSYPVLLTPVEYVLSSVLALLGGGIIVFSYWSSASDAFTKKAT